MSENQPAEFIDTQLLTNDESTAQEIVFEPWCMFCTLLPGETLRVVGRSDRPGKLEVVAADGMIAVYGWNGSTLLVYKDETLVLDINFTFPELPPGITARGFVDQLFGGPGPVIPPSPIDAREPPPPSEPWWKFW